MNVTEIIHEYINDALVELKLPIVNFGLDHPASEAHGDYACNVAMVLFPILKKVGRGGEYPNPRALADAIVSNLKLAIQPSSHSAIIDSVEVAGPGFINFTLSNKYFLENIQTITQLQEKYGTKQLTGKKLAIIEYSSPNIAKPFTFGHLRSTVIGDSIANIYEAVGWQVLRDNHLGDWGTQFGKLIYAVKTWGNESALETSDHPVKDLVELYVKFHDEAEKNPKLEDKGRAWFSKLEKGDASARLLWQKCIDWSWQEFSRIYAKLEIKHSEIFEGGRGLGESFFENKMTPVIEELIQKKLLKDGKEGAKLVFFDNDKYPPAMILKKDGSTLYHTRDLATDKYRLDNFKPDLIINEVGAEQDLYFKQLFEIESLLGWFKPEQRIHVGHGFIRFRDRKMSTRKGDVVWLDEVIAEAEKRALKLQKHQNVDLAAVVGIGALKWNDLKGSSSREIIFDWSEILNMKGNSGPYLQYTHARCHSVLEKSGINYHDLKISNQSSVISNPAEVSLLRFFYRYPEVVAQAAAELAPHLICTYLYELAQRFNTFYNQHSILGSADKPINRLTVNFRLLLTAATAQILKNGLHLLGISSPEAM